MTSNQNHKIRQLLKLAELSQEFEHIDFKTVDAFNELREEHGLSKTLLLIKTYVKTNRSNIQSTDPSPQVSEPQHPNQNPDVVQ